MRLCNYKRVNFTTYRRGNNLSFFQLYTSMVGTPVDRCVRTILGKFPRQEDVPTWSITVSHNQRIRLNKQINDEMHKSRGGVWIDPVHQCDGQGCWLFDDMHVVGVATDQGIFNGQLYTVAGILPDVVRLRVYNQREQFDLKMCNIRSIRPAHALTYYSCQGRTLCGRIRLYVQHSKLTTTHVIVGLSRATCPSLIDCV